ncbi:MAG: hypothetical protein ACOC1K_06570 [Nanoarchaeota archaeon]
MAQKNYIYRIWDKENKRYVSPGRKSKSSWSSIKWAASAIEDIVRVYNRQKGDFEILKFKLTLEERYNADSILNEINNIENSKDVLRCNINKIENDIEDLFDNKLKYYQIIELFDSFDKTIQDNINELLKEKEKFEKELKELSKTNV